MPFYFRKSVSAGPFRFNFSKGGVGVSVGVRGLRVGTGPKGHYIHAGRGGVYYRASLARAGDRRERLASPTPAFQQEQLVFSDSGVDMVEIESGNVQEMRDEAFGDVLDEINAKQQQVKLASLLGLGLGFVGVIMTFVAGPGAAPALLLGLFGWAAGRWLDSYRRTTVLFYELEPETHAAYEATTAAFDAMVGCAAKWHVEAGGAVRDLTTWKRNAGASHIVQKKPTELSYKLPTVIKCNITPPTMHVGRQIIYFLPDVALIDDGGKFGAVGYRDLRLQWQDSRFIEEGTVPRDAVVVAHTWKHPNKSGGPDRRFNNNFQIPICRYEVLHLKSASGLNELVEFSRTGVAMPFEAALKRLPDHANSLQLRAG